MKQLIFFSLLVNCITSYGQDKIVLLKGDTILAKVLKINTDEILYKKHKNLGGPDYSLSTNQINQIIFENGEKEFFNVSSTDEMNITTPESAINRGNRVFITSADATSKKGEEYFIQNLSGWGYWDITDKKELAHFILVLNIERKGMGIFKVWAVFKTIDGKEFKVSESYSKSVSAFNGYNVARPLCEKLVDDYFKNEFR